jgi:hypothetical protein
MPHYRVHILDRGGRLLAAFDLDCTDDEDAKGRINEVLGGFGGELWRLVAVFGPDGPSIQPSHEELLTSGRRRRSYKRRTKSH